TRSYGDWSSDVCSSDLEQEAEARERDPERPDDRPELPADEEEQRRQEIRPRARRARRGPPHRMDPGRRPDGDCSASHRPAASPQEGTLAPGDVIYFLCFFTSAMTRSRALASAFLVS